MIARVRSGIVKIDALSCDGEGIGTGFLIGPRLVATVDHVVDGATKVSLIRNGQRIATGRVIGSDPSRDLALVQTSAPVRGFEFKFAKRSPRLGERVIALGFPLNLPLTVTQGSVSGLGRTIPIDGVQRRQLVQTDAAVNHGNSGGPLLSTETGEVIGLVDLGSTSLNGTAFAVSASVAGGLDEAWKAAPQPLAPVACLASPVGSGSSGSTPTTTTSPPAEAAIPSGVYSWVNTAADLKAQHVDSSYIAENAGIYTMSLSGGNWTLLQKSGTAKHTLLTGQYETYGDRRHLHDRRASRRQPDRHVRGRQPGPSRTPLSPLPTSRTLPGAASWACIRGSESDNPSPQPRARQRRPTGNRRALRLT